MKLESITDSKVKELTERILGMKGMTDEEALEAGLVFHDETDADERETLARYCIHHQVAIDESIAMVMDLEDPGVTADLVKGILSDIE